MRTRYPVSAFLVAASLVLASGAVRAAGVAEDFDTLKGQRDEAIARDKAAANAQYRAKLESLLKLTAQRGDLDGALKVRAAITELDESGKVQEIRRWLVGSEWVWGGQLPFRFNEDGTFTIIGRQLWFLKRWELGPGLDLSINSELGNLYYKFKDGAYVQDMAKSGWKERKSISVKGVPPADVSPDPAKAPGPAGAPVPDKTSGPGESAKDATKAERPDQKPSPGSDALPEPNAVPEPKGTPAPRPAPKSDPDNTLFGRKTGTGDKPDAPQEPAR